MKADTNYFMLEQNHLHIGEILPCDMVGYYMNYPKAYRM